MQETALSLAMLMVLALPLGAWALWRRGGSRKQVVLMLILAAILAANVAIWVIPTKNGAAPVAEQLR
jgi:peptidoglycan/LPS O-acetylase OafA/YrhL